MSNLDKPRAAAVPIPADGKLPTDLGATISPEAFAERFLALHKQLFASTEQPFDEVMVHVLAPQPGMAQFDHEFIHDDAGRLHLFYGTGDQSRKRRGTSASRSATGKAPTR